jgi:hypothetical protein
MARKVHPAEEIDTRSERFDKAFVRMKVELQFLFQEQSHIWDCSLEVVSVRVEDDEVVGVAEVVLCFECVLHVLVKFVHINIDEKLGGEVAKRKPTSNTTIYRSVRCGGEAVDDVCEKRENLFVQNTFCKSFLKDFVINGGEELSDVALENPCGAGIVLGHFVCEGAEAVECSVRSLAFSAGEGICDECTIEKRMENAIYGVMQEAVSHKCLVNVAGFRVCDTEVLIWAVAVCTVF